MHSHAEKTEFESRHFTCTLQPYTIKALSIHGYTEEASIKEARNSHFI